MDELRTMGVPWPKVVGVVDNVVVPRSTTINGIA